MKKIFINSLLLAAMFMTMAMPLLAAESALFPFNGGTGKYEEATVNFNGDDWRLTDFSMAGYKRGEVPLRDGVPCNVVTVTGSGDITSELQTLINSLSATGGIVRIPAGTYTISSMVGIFYDNISVEGAGSENTIINVPSSWTPDEAANTYEAIFNIEPGNSGWHKGWIEGGTELSQVTNTISEGDTYITGLTNLGNVNAGDWIVVQQYFWPAFISAYGGGTWPTPNRSYSFTYLRQVVSKDASGITVDIPILWDLNPANNTIYIKRSGPAQGMIQNSGVSGLSIDFAYNNNGPTGRPIGAGVYWEGAVNCWAYDVHLHNFPRYGFYPQSSARISIIDCAVKKTQDYGGDGYGYGYHIGESQSILMKRCFGEDMRHSFILQKALSNYVVMTDCESLDIRLGDDTHHSMCHAVLRDNYRMTHSNKLAGYDRGTTSSNAFETYGSGVLWNLIGDDKGGTYESRQIEMNPIAAGWGIMAGSPGKYNIYDNSEANGTYTQGDLISPIAGLQVGPNGDQKMLYTNLDAPVSPLSLYETQLENRLGSLIPDWDTACGVHPAIPAATATPDTGAGIHVYDSDSAGGGVSFGSGCPLPLNTLTPGCNFDDHGQNHTAGGIEGIRLDPTGSNWTPLINFGPGEVDTTVYDNIEMWIYTNNTNLDFYMNLREEFSDTVLGSTVTVSGAHVSGGWVAGAWNHVVIPLSAFGYSGVFNYIRISNTNNTLAAGTFYMDDIKITGASLPTDTETYTSTPTSTETDTIPADTETFTATATETYTETFTETDTETITQTPTETATAGCGKRYLAYYPYWDPSYKEDKIPYSNLTHICHAFADPEANGSVTAPAGYLEPALITNAHAAGVKVLVSIGGANATSNTNFSTIAASAPLRAAFADNVYNFCVANGYDGVDVDWEFPANATDRTNQNLLLQAIRDKFDSSPAPAPSWEITMAVSPGNWYGQWNDYAALNGIVSFYNLMTYDFHGSWSDHAGHNAPLFLGGDPYAGENVADGVDYMITTRGVPADMINMGLPFYGRHFINAENLYDADATEAAGSPPNYYDIVPLIGNGWTENWDAGSEVPYITNDSGTGLITYDNPVSIALKVDYALSTRDLGGIFMWEITGDYITGVQALKDAMDTQYTAFCSGATPADTGTPTDTATSTETGTETWVLSTETETLIADTETFTETPTETETVTVTGTPTQTNTPSYTISDMILVDQIGYRVDSDKWVMIKNPITGYDSAITYTPGASVELHDASNDALVMTIPLTAWNGGAEHTASGDAVWQGDFSSVTTPGTYYILDPANSTQSYNFEIRDDIYNAVLEASVKSYYYQRSGLAIVEPYGEGWTHAASHPQQQNALLYDSSLGGIQTGTERDISGGWYDAGDYRKYTSWMAPVIWDLGYAYEFFPDNFSDSTNIPESGNGVPDILDEMKYEVDWMLRMQRGDGALYSGCFVVSGINGTSGGDGDPSLEDRPYFYANYSTAATASGAAAFAILSRLLESSGAYPGYAATLRTAAENAWTFLQANPTNIQYDHTNFNNANANQSASSDAALRLMAAAELFRLTGDGQYSAYLDSNYNSSALTDGTHNPILSGYFETGASSTTQKGLLSYAVAAGATGSVVAAIKSSLNQGIQNGPYGQRNNDPYKEFMWDGHYTWGSNAMKAGWGYMAMLGSLLDVNPPLSAAYLDVAEEYVHYYHGRNPLNIVYYTEADRFGGDKFATEIFHGWYFDGTIWDTNPAPGYVPGGPNQYFSTDASYSGPALEPPLNQPPMKSYLDWNTSWPENSWEVTENSTGYQSRVILLLSAFGASAGPTATPTDSPTSECWPGICTETETIQPTETYTETNTPTATPTLDVTLFNPCETLLDNGTWTGGNATRSINTSNVSAITQGSGSMQVDINTVSAWQDGGFTLGGFTPSDFSNVESITMDIYVPAGLEPWGAADGWHSLTLYVNTTSITGAKYYRQIFAGTALQTGMNNITIPLNWALDTGSVTDPDPAPIDPTDAVNGLIFVINSQTGGTGTLYVDNMQLVLSGGPTPMTTETETETFTETETQTFTETETETLVETETETQTVTFSSTSTETFTETPTETDTVTETETATATPTLEVVITDVSPAAITVGTDTSANISFDNPDPLTSVTVYLYTDAMSLVDSYTDASAQSAGSNIITIALDNGATGIDFSTVPAGNYLIVVEVTDGTYTGVSNSFPITVTSAAPTFTFTMTPTESDTYTITETETETFAETETPSETDTVADTETETPTNTSTSSVSNTETPTQTYTFTATYTQTFTQTYTMTATSTPTLSINITLASPSTINVGIDTDLYVYFDNNRAVTSIDAQLQDIFGAPLQTVTLPASAFAAGSNSIIIPLDDAVNGFDLAAAASDSYRLVLIAANGVDTATSPMSLLTINGAPTVTETETLPAVNTSTETPTFTYTHTFTETPVLTNTETQTPYPSVTPTPTQGDTLEITDIYPYPNPFNPTLPGASARFTFKISQTDIDSIALRMYTSGYRLVKEVIFEEGALAQVLSRKYIQYNAEDLLNMANGTYYYLIIAEKDGEVVRSKVDKLIILK